MKKNMRDFKIVVGEEGGKGWVEESVSSFFYARPSLFFGDGWKVLYFCTLVKLWSKCLISENITKK